MTPIAGRRARPVGLLKSEWIALKPLQGSFLSSMATLQRRGKATLHALPQAIGVLVCCAVMLTTCSKRDHESKKGYGTTPDLFISWYL